MNFTKLNLGIISNKLVSQGLGALVVIYLKYQGELEEISNYTLILTFIALASNTATFGRQNALLAIFQKYGRSAWKSFVWRTRMVSVIIGAFISSLILILSRFSNVEIPGTTIILLGLAILFGAQNLINVEVYRTKKLLIVAEFFRMTLRTSLVVLVAVVFSGVVSFTNGVLIAVIVAGMLSFTSVLPRLPSYGQDSTTINKTEEHKVDTYAWLWSLLLLFVPALIVLVYRVAGMEEFSGNTAFYLRLSEVFGLVIMALNTSLEPFIDCSMDGQTKAKMRFNVHARRLTLAALIVVMVISPFLGFISIWERIIWLSALAAKGVQLFFGPVIAILRIRLKFYDLFVGYLLVGITQLLVWLGVVTFTGHYEFAIFGLPLGVGIGFYWMYRHIDLETKRKWRLGTKLM